VSLVSLLGVVLPGSVVTFLGLVGPLRPSLPHAVVGVQEGSPEGWAIFLIASYVVGQALYGFGSWFLDGVYDRTYRRYKEYLKGDPKDYVRSLIDAHFPEGPQPSTYSWSRAYVVTKSPASMNELEQIEADFKFFRSLALVFLVAPFEAIRLPNARWIWLLIGGLSLTVFGSLAKVVVELIHQRTRRRSKQNSVGSKRGESLKPADPSRPSWALDITAALTSAGLAIVLIEGAALISDVAHLPGAVFYLVGFAVVFLRFCQQRWQRNETTYEYAAAVAAPDSASAITKARK